VAVSSPETTQPADPETGPKERSSSSNIIYSHTGNVRASRNIENSTDEVIYSRPSTRSYGADGTLLNKIDDDRKEKVDSSLDETKTVNSKPTLQVCHTKGHLIDSHYQQRVQ
jgi:hypothetical protein